MLFTGILHAEDAVKLPGSRVKSEEAALHSSAVFVGKVTNEGVRGPYFNIYYTEISNLQITVLQVLRGSSPNPVALSLNVAGNEAMPKTGNTYIFFVQKPTALKLLPATDDNIAMVKKLVSN